MIKSKVHKGVNQCLCSIFRKMASDPSNIVKIVKCCRARLCNVDGINLQISVRQNSKFMTGVSAGEMSLISANGYVAKLLTCSYVQKLIQLQISLTHITQFHASCGFKFSFVVTRAKGKTKLCICGLSAVHVWKMIFDGVEQFISVNSVQETQAGTLRGFPPQVELL